MPDFQKIFNNDYPGADSFLKNVLAPIFPAGSIDKFRAPVDILTNQAKLTRANFVKIKSILNIAEIYVETLESPIQIYDVTLDDHCQLSRSRVGIQQLVRAEVQQYSNIFILFHYESSKGREWRFSYAFKGKSQSDITPAKRYTYLFGKDHNSRTADQRFNDLCGKEINEALLQEAFSVEALSKEFFDEYRATYEKFCHFLYTHKRDPRYFGQEFHDRDDDQCDDYVKKMLGRILFLQFIQKKGWMCGDPNYTRNLFRKTNYQGDFLDRVLEPLFFGVLNTTKPEREELFRKKKWDLQLLDEWQGIPYLNGGLFEPDFIDPPKSVFDKRLYAELFDLFDRYNFTIDENDPDDAEVGVDPEMLGKIFENQLKDNKGKGAFYTPKEIVQYMCRESLIAYLTTRCPQVGKDVIRRFILTHEFPEDADIITSLDKALWEVKICDPAIGSGAFPMGMLHELYKCHTALNDEKNDGPTSIKREIIQSNLYGVDIEKGAVDIARLRFWLSLVVTEECEEGKDPDTLPNLDYKIMQGNSLVESYKGADLSKLIPTDNSGFNRQMYMFEDGIRERKHTLSKCMEKYFDCSNHQEKDKFRRTIQDNIREQIKHDWKGDSLEKIEDLSCTPEFFLWHTWFFNIFENGGFDIIIGNPPYIKEGTKRSAFDGFRETSPYYQGKMDIWYGFACHAIDLLKKNGILCFIATNNWVTNAGAKKLRQKVIADTQILQLVDFGSYMIFEESASIQTMIMLFQVNSIDDNYTFDFRKLTKSEASKKDALLLLEKEQPEAIYIAPKVNRINLRTSLLTFSNVSKNSLLDKINTGATYLDAHEATNGIHPHHDFVNKKMATAYPKFAIGEGIFGLTNEELTNLNLSKAEMGLIRPYFTSEQIFRYYTYPHNSLWLIYTDSSFKNPHSMDSFPHIKKHLDRYAELITSDNKPYGLHRARQEQFFRGEKIVCQRKCVGHPIFAYSDFDVYVSATFYVIQTGHYDMKFLTGLFNSRLIEFWLRNKGKMQGENFQVDKEPILAIPIKRTSEAEKAISTIVSKIIEIKHQNSQADTTSEERAIDLLVYTLYGLTAEEIAIVEGSGTSPVPAA